MQATLLHFTIGDLTTNGYIMFSLLNLLSRFTIVVPRATGRELEDNDGAGCVVGVTLSWAKQKMTVTRQGETHLR